ncbi:hypothetical protein HanIR_Chr17g0846371 [Helianthus annuus]|nr:hypothetical protein HanIR_Chr17g0846371 [Helianthus annuus]
MGRITKIKSSRLSVLLLDGGKMKKFGIKIKKKLKVEVGTKKKLIVQLHLRINFARRLSLSYEMFVHYYTSYAPFSIRTSQHLIEATCFSS